MTSYPTQKQEDIFAYVRLCICIILFICFSSCIATYVNAKKLASFNRRLFVSHNICVDRIFTCICRAPAAWLFRDILNSWRKDLFQIISSTGCVVVHNIIHTKVCPFLQYSFRKRLLWCLGYSAHENKVVRSIPGDAFFPWARNFISFRPIHRDCKNK